jgi:hypothetical protein
MVGKVARHGVWRENHPGNSDTSALPEVVETLTGFSTAF